MMDWLKAKLETWQGWVATITGACALAFVMVKTLRKCIAQLNTAYEGGIFVLNIKDEIAKLTQTINDRCDRIERGVINTISVRRAVMEADEIKAWFEARPDGSFEWANRLWRVNTGMEQHEIAGDGWINGVAENERDKLMADWKRCVATGIAFDHTATLVDRRGRTTRVRLSAVPGRGDHDSPIVVYTGHATAL